MFNAAHSHHAAPPAGNEWYMDTGATSHVTNSTGTLTSYHSPSSITSRSIVVGNGSKLPITSYGSAHLTKHPFYLHNVLVSSPIVKNLISVRKFTIDNWCSVEFDPYGFSVKNLATGRILMRPNSPSDLYPFFGASSPDSAAFSTTITPDLWHRRLGHPSNKCLSQLSHDFLISCNKLIGPSPLREACQLGRQPRLPFSTSSSSTTAPFQLIHCGLWTSPIPSFSGFNYYLVILDDYSYYSWTFPLRNKSDTASTLQRFFSFIRTQFHLIIQCVQCDNDGEFLNTELCAFLYLNVSPTASPAHIPLLKMAKLNASYAPLMISSEHFLSRPIFHRNSGLRPCTRPHIYSIFAHQEPSISPLPISSFTVSIQIMIT